jgi:protoporphyrinogen oxidase
MTLHGDGSYKKFLASEFDAATTTLEDTGGRDVVLVVDTATWYVYYNGTWYEQ